MNRIVSVALLLVITILSGGCISRYVDWAESLEIKGNFVDASNGQLLSGVQVTLFRNTPRNKVPNPLGESKDGILNAHLERKWGNLEVAILPGMYMHRKDRFVIVCKKDGYKTVEKVFPRPKYVSGEPTRLDLGLVEMNPSSQP